MPGLSYAMMRNYAKGGLECSLFFSHAVRTYERAVAFETLHDSHNSRDGPCADLM